MKIIPKLLFILITFPSAVSYSQIQQPMNASDIQLALRKLNTIGSVLYVAAHPDDENTRLISFLARERCYRTGYLSITRGDGGQNLIGKEQGESLGLIRTNELLQARNIDGGEQYFTRANDFGYSKNPEETFSIWNKEITLSDVVWVIRNFKPDVIICRFPTTGEGGHGHHTASAILAEEAFDAAADPTKFPEQLKYVQPWKTKRLFWNTFNFGGTNTTSDSQMKLDVGIYNPLLGKGYGEIASESRSMHKSQGFGSARTRGSQIEYFKQLKGEKVEQDIFKDITTSWNRFPETAELTSLLLKVINKFNPADPGSILSDLNIINQKINNIKSIDPEIANWKKKKSDELLKIIIACSGAFMEAYSENYSYVSGDSIKVSAVFISRLYEGVTLKSINFAGNEKNKPTVINKTDTIVFKTVIPDSINNTNPYWLNTDHSEGLYTVNSQLLIGKPINDDPLVVKYEINIADNIYTIYRPVTYKFTDPVKGELYRKLEILPKVTINFSEKNYIVNNGKKKRVAFTIKANSANVTGKILFTNAMNWKIELPVKEFTLKNKNDEQIFYADISPLNVDNDYIYLKPIAVVNNKEYKLSMNRIDYDHIPPQFILGTARSKVISLNISTVKKKIGYIAGAGDDVAECLRQMNYDVTEITDAMLASSDLSSYQTIVTGVRAYNTNDRLQTYYDKLMGYINQGGTLLVQYNTNNRIGPLVAKIGPYPFTISRDRVTDEKAPVTIKQQSHQLFSAPNTITDDDFKDWIQERGIYFATERDSNYQTVMMMNDPDEKPLDGSIIVADYGKGHFIYTGLSFFRELPAGVPGAFRLFANLLEY
jgi:LmbE family N-acetylglucosaminyl deacetylase